jgi:hypothetical protein
MWKNESSAFESLSALRSLASAFQASEKSAGYRSAQAKQASSGTTEFNQPGQLANWVLPSFALWVSQSADLRPAVLGDASVLNHPLSSLLLVMLPFNLQQQRPDHFFIVHRNLFSPPSNRFICLPATQTNPEPSIRHSRFGVDTGKTLTIFG